MPQHVEDHHEGRDQEGDHHGDPHELTAPRGSLPGSRQQFALQWTDLLQQAVREPGLILEAYHQFHGYSLGNRLAALHQCHQRGLQPGPLNTYPGWQKLGRQVRPGEKALWLCMPLTRRPKTGQEKAGQEPKKPHRGQHPPQQPSSAGGATDPLSADAAEPKAEFISGFAWKPHWFVLCQTQSQNGEDKNSEGQPEAASPPAATVGKWDKARALQTLGITEIPFEEMDGNCQGYATGQSVAVSPLAALPHKTRFHEIAHVLLGHTAQGTCIDGETLTRGAREVEAESVALLLLASLELPGIEYCRGYIQHWLEGDEIPEASARRIFHAADRILAAGLTIDEASQEDHQPAGAEAGTESSQNTPPQPITPHTATPHTAIPHSAQLVLMDNLAPAEPEESVPPLPRIDWTQFDDWEPEAAPPSSSAPPHSPTRPEPTHAGPPENLETARLPAYVPPATFALHDEGELDLYHLHGLLVKLHADLHPALPDAQRAIVEALRYLETKDLTRAEVVGRLLKLAAFALDEASDLVQGGIHWPTVEAFFCPPEQFVDTPQNWLAVGTANGQTNGQTNGGSGGAETPGPDAQSTTDTPAGANGSAANGVTGEMPPALAALVAQGLPALSPTREAAARRRVGRSLRAECEAEKRRFYKIATEHGLPTGPEAAVAIRAALSELFGVAIQSRKELTAKQWGQAASAIETEDLTWRV